MSAWSLVGLLISVRVGAAAARSTTMARRVDAVDEVPNFMKKARPALTRRRLDVCLGQTACYADGSPCATGEFCNFDEDSYGYCEQCSSFGDVATCYAESLPSDGALDCHACCFGGTPATAAPSMTFAPTPTPPYEYASTVDAMPHCKLSDSSVCWGNTHRFLTVTANGPFHGMIGIDVGDYSRPALGDLDGDGTRKPRPSTDKL